MKLAIQHSGHALYKYRAFYIFGNWWESKAPERTSDRKVNMSVPDVVQIVVRNVEEDEVPILIMWSGIPCPEVVEVALMQNKCLEYG